MGVESIVLFSKGSAGELHLAVIELTQRFALYCKRMRR